MAPKLDPELEKLLKSNSWEAQWITKLRTKGAGTSLKQFCCLAATEGDARSTLCSLVGIRASHAPAKAALLVAAWVDARALGTAPSDQVGQVGPAPSDRSTDPITAWEAPCSPETAEGWKDTFRMLTGFMWPVLWLASRQNLAAIFYAFSRRALPLFPLAKIRYETQLSLKGGDGQQHLSLGAGRTLMVNVDDDDLDLSLTRSWFCAIRALLCAYVIIGAQSVAESSAWWYSVSSMLDYLSILDRHAFGDNRLPLAVLIELDVQERTRWSEACTNGHLTLEQAYIEGKPTRVSSFAAAWTAEKAKQDTAKKQKESEAKRLREQVALDKAVKRQRLNAYNQQAQAAHNHGWPQQNSHNQHNYQQQNYQPHNFTQLAPQPPFLKGGKPKGGKGKGYTQGKGA